MFTPKQVQALRGPLDRAHVREREQSGRKLSYIEGWHAEAEANRIFGEHAWDSVIIAERCVAERSRKIGKEHRDGWGVSYVCTVRVTVTTPEGHTVVRDGVGAGHGIDVDLGLAHESAIKEAATDAEKRALKTFGNPFGLALYDKTQANVVKIEPKISDEQARVLADLMQRTDTSAERFCAHFQIGALPDLPASRFGAAKASLERKLKREAA